MIKITSLDENTQIFLDYVDKTLKKYRFTLVLSMDDLTVGKNPVGGTFDEIDKTLEISIKDEGWLEILVHEFNHFLQWIEQDLIFLKISENGSNMSEQLWAWLDKEIELSKERVSEIIQSIIDMELDCERRSVKMIKEFSLPIDIKEYIYTAYVYLNFYNYVKKHRTWFKQKVFLADIKEIRETKNIHLRGNFRRLPKGFEEIFRKYCRKSLTT